MCEICLPQNSASIINNYYTLAQQIYYHKDISRKRNLAILSFDSSQFDWSFVEIWTCKVDYFSSSKTIGISSFWGCKTMKYNHIWKTSMFMLCFAHFRWINNITHTYFQIIDRIEWRKQHELGAKSCEIFWNNVCLNINYRVCIYWVWLSNKPPSWDGISSGSLLLFVVC